MASSHPDGYNVSKLVEHFHSLSHYKLSNGLVDMSNRTFDLFRTEYLNSMFTISFAIPQMFLFIFLVLYLFYCWIVRKKSAKRTIEQIVIEHPYRFAVHKPNRLCGLNYWHRWQILAIGCIILVVILFSIVWFILAISQTAESLDNFINKSNESLTHLDGVNQTISKWNLLKPLQNNDTHSWLTRTQLNLNFLYKELQVDEQGNNLLLFRHFHRLASWLFVVGNVVSATLVCVYLVVFVLLHLMPKCLTLRCMIVLNIAVLIFLTCMFGMDLGTNMAGADFCSDAKSVMYDMVQHRIYNNSAYTRPVVRYYLYCGIKNWWDLESHKNKMVDALESWGNVTVLSISLNQWMHLQHVKGQLEQTYKSVTCSQLNQIINLGLTQFCTQPLDAITLMMVAHLGAILLLMFTLFAVTFKV